MTKMLDSSAGRAGARPPLVTRPLLLRFVSIVGASTSFYLLLSVVPLYAEASSGGRGGAAGLATGALMLATVGGELATPGSSPASATASCSGRGSSSSVRPRSRSPSRAARRGS
ncbi:hypothetical protein ACQ86F_33585 [Streptomyces venezuelae ATCC 10712]